jgi:hypothetical protein
MKRKFSVKTLFVLLLCVPSLLLFIGCSGGGGGSSTGSSAGGTGTVAILLTDCPSEDYDNIWIWITEISLLPEDDNADPVVVFKSDSPEGWKVDLLDLRDQDAVVTVKDNIPAGRYCKIRLRIADVQPEGGTGPCDSAEMEIKLPSGKIDLNPKGGFAITPGETVSIRLDVDVDKSINLHPAGKSGKCIFRPVVFVDIEKKAAPPKCPRVLKGVISEVFAGDTGFTLLLGEGREPLTVYLADGVIIFGENGSPVAADTLEAGQTVHVRGRLDAQGDLQASVIVIGNVVLVKGIVNTDFDGEMFALELLPPHIFTQNIVNVAVDGNTFVMTRCDQQVAPEAIKAGMLARVVGKISLEDQSIRAIAVLLKEKRVTGQLTAIDPAEGGYVLTVQVSATETVEIFMPGDVDPYMGNIGPLSMEVIQGLLNCGRTLEVSITVVAEDPAMLTATEVQVYPEKVAGVVTSVQPIDQYGMVEVMIGDKIVYIPNTAIIEDHRDSGIDEPLNTDIKAGQNLLVMGLPTCQASEVYEFYEASMVIILEPEPQT